MRNGMHTGMVCYAGICVCYMCATDYTLRGTGRRDGVQVRGMCYANMHKQASMRYAACEACKMGQKCYEMPAK